MNYWMRMVAVQKEVFAANVEFGSWIQQKFELFWDILSILPKNINFVSVWYYITIPLISNFAPFRPKFYFSTPNCRFSWSIFVNSKSIFDPFFIRIVTFDRKSDFRALAKCLYPRCDQRLEMFIICLIKINKNN